MTTIQLDREMILDLLLKSRALVDTDTDEGVRLQAHLLELITLVSGRAARQGRHTGTDQCGTGIRGRTGKMPTLTENARTAARQLDRMGETDAADALDGTLRRVAQGLFNPDPIAALSRQVTLLSRRLKQAEMTIARHTEQLKGSGPSAPDDSDTDEVAADNLTTYGPTTVNAPQGSTTQVSAMGGDVDVSL